MKIKNDMVEKQLSHRSIRSFKDEKIPDGAFQLLMEVAQRTANSNGLQTSSIIRIRDEKVKKEIAESCMQEYIVKLPELLIFIVDQYRNSQIVKEKGYDYENFKGMDNFFSSFTDACITAQNVVNAAEALGLGTVYLGSILNDPERMCQILQLPKLTFPVLGLGLGYPNEEPQLKPRMSMEYRVFENKYKVFDNYLETLKDYDEEMYSYYGHRDTNKRTDTFTNQVVTKLKYTSPQRQEILKTVKKMGFKLFPKDAE